MFARVNMCVKSDLLENLILHHLEKMDLMEQHGILELLHLQPPTSTVQVVVGHIYFRCKSKMYSLLLLLHHFGARVTSIAAVRIVYGARVRCSWSWLGLQLKIF